MADLRAVEESTGRTTDRRRFRPSLEWAGMGTIQPSHQEAAVSAHPSPRADDADVVATSTATFTTASDTGSGAAPASQDASGRPADDAELRAAIRRLGDLLGQTLVRQHGSELLEQVEAIRALGKQGADVSELLAEVDPEQAIKLVRAF